MLYGTEISDFAPQQAHGGQFRGGDGVFFHRMGRGLHLLPCLVPDPLRVQRDAAAVRAEHFQRVAQAPLTPLLAAGDAVLPAVHSAHELPLADVGGAVGGLLGLLAAKKMLYKLLTTELNKKLQQIMLAI